MSTWTQGSHVALIGQTGSGKTTLAQQLLKLRGHCIMLVTKPDDLTWAGWRNVATVDKIDASKWDKWRLWPSWERMEREFLVAMMMVWNEANWCVYSDETYHLERIGLKSSIEKLLTQGRSKGISVVTGMQRPSWVSRFNLSEVSHVFSFSLGDKRDLKTLADGVSDEYAEAVAKLSRFEFAYVDKRERKIIKARSGSLSKVFACVVE